MNPELLGLQMEENGQLALPFRLTGSQAKTAYALRLNVESMITGNSRKRLQTIVLQDGREHGVYVAERAENLHCVGFLTLTVGDVVATEEPQLDGTIIKRERFEQVFDAAEASRRINNLNRRVLADLFERSVIVTERHKNGAVHFHVVGILRGRPDIRTGFDFDAVKGRDYRSASLTLRCMWEHLRDVLPRYGFGRSELTPIRTTGEAIASYVSKYIEKNICNRLTSDKNKKLVRYLGWEKSQLKPNDFSWGTKRATEWRTRARRLASFVGITRKEDMQPAFGPRWAMIVTRLMNHVDAAWPVPFWEMERGEVRKATLRLKEEMQWEVVRELETKCRGAVVKRHIQQCSDFLGTDYGEWQAISA
jgi:hypothetical protein